jgi:anti-anti-sigma regulatory factor
MAYHDPRVTSDLTPETAVGRSLYDKVIFSQAQGVLVGLTGCSPGRAAHALLDTAFQQLLSPGEVAQSLLRSITTDNDQDGSILTGLAAIALEPDAEHQPHPVIRIDGVGRTSESSILHVVETWDGGVPGVRAHGELDLATVPDLMAAVGRAGRWPVGHEQDPGRTVWFRLDLEGITFLDLTGVRILNAIHDQITEDGRYVMTISTPIAQGCRRLLALAVHLGWLPAGFDPALLARA